MLDIGQMFYNFKDLTAWQEGHKLVLIIYKITANFPKSETFGLTDQIRRAVVSVTSNIAEGFGRGSYKERAQFFNLSRGSLSEIDNQLIIAKDLGYINLNTYTQLENQRLIVHKLVQSLLTKTKLFIKNPISNL